MKSINIPSRPTGALYHELPADFHADHYGKHTAANGELTHPAAKKFIELVNTNTLGRTDTGGMFEQMVKLLETAENSVFCDTSDKQEELLVLLYNLCRGFRETKEITYATVMLNQIPTSKYKKAYTLDIENPTWQAKLVSSTIPIESVLAPYNLAYELGIPELFAPQFLVDLPNGCYLENRVKDEESPEYLSHRFGVSKYNVLSMLKPRYSSILITPLLPKPAAHRVSTPYKELKLKTREAAFFGGKSPFEELKHETAAEYGLSRWNWLKIIHEETVGDEPLLKLMFLLRVLRPLLDRDSCFRQSGVVGKDRLLIADWDW